MSILTVSGSARSDSTNTALLKALPAFLQNKEFIHFEQLTSLPLYTVAADSNPLPTSVIVWRKAVAEATAVIFSTPEYIHNLPAVLKNALEWLSASGELVGKSVLAITFLPNEPRGEKAMTSLTWSLKALDSKIVAALPLYQTDLQIVAGEITGGEEALEMLREAVGLLM